MAEVTPKYDHEEFARRGDEIYERVVRPHLQTEDKGKFVAIDLESDAYELDRDMMAAADRLRDRFPEAQIWFRRVGFPVTMRFGCWHGDKVCQ
jgi:hypothetical protein